MTALARCSTGLKFCNWEIANPGRDSAPGTPFTRRPLAAPKGSSKNNFPLWPVSDRASSGTCFLTGPKSASPDLAAKRRRSGDRLGYANEAASKAALLTQPQQWEQPLDYKPPHQGPAVGGRAPQIVNGAALLPGPLGSSQDQVLAQ